MTKSSSGVVIGTKIKVAPAKKAPRKIALKKTGKAPLAMAARKIQTTNTGIKRNPLGHLLMEKMLREAGFHGEVSSKKELLDTYSTKVFFLFDRKSSLDLNTKQTLKL
jgi:hypothetical protein